MLKLERSLWQQTRLQVFGREGKELELPKLKWNGCFWCFFFYQVAWLFQLGKSVFVCKVSTISIAENFSQSCRIEVISRTLFCLFVLCGCPVYVYFLWGVLSWKMLTSVLSDGYVLKPVGTETSELSGVVQAVLKGVAVQFSINSYVCFGFPWHQCSHRRKMLSWKMVVFKSHFCLGGLTSF